MFKDNPSAVPYWYAVESAGVTVHGVIDLRNHSDVWGWCVCGTLHGHLLFGFESYSHFPERECSDLDLDECWWAVLGKDEIVELGKRYIENRISYERLLSRIKHSKLGKLDRVQLVEWLAQLPVVQAYMARRAAAATLAALLAKPLSSQ